MSRIGRKALLRLLAGIEGEEGRTRYGGGEARFELPAETIVVRPPFPFDLEAEADRVDTGPLAAELERDRLVAVLLVRLGGYAAGVLEGERLVASKVGTRFVKGRHKKGGSSSSRFRRRREEQARALIDEAAATAVETLGPWLPRVEHAALGGDRDAVRKTLAARPELAPLETLALPRFLTVPDPRQRVLAGLPFELYSSELTRSPA